MSLRETMIDEQINEAWWKYLEITIKYTVKDLPNLFLDPHCGTCTHWYLIDADDLNYLAASLSLTEYKQIIDDLKGERVYRHPDRGEVEDVYYDYRFYGWCRRMPPSQRSGYLNIKLGFLFRFLNRNIRKKITGYNFPLISHTCSCGEWKKSGWVTGFINNHKRKPERMPGKDAIKN